jgi:hypothetical protein
MWTSGAELSCSGRGSSFTGEEAFSGAGEDAGAEEVVWMADGMSGCAAAADLSTLGLALELEACSGVREALKERKHQVNSQREKYVGNNIKGRNLPRGNGSLPLGLRYADHLPFGLLSWFGLGLHSAFLTHAYAGRGRSLIQRSSVDDFLVRDS